MNIIKNIKKAIFLILVCLFFIALILDELFFIPKYALFEYEGKMHTIAQGFYPWNETHRYMYYSLTKEKEYIPLNVDHIKLIKLVVIEWASLILPAILIGIIHKKKPTD